MSLLTVADLKEKEANSFMGDFDSYNERRRCVSSRAWSKILIGVGIICLTFGLVLATNSLFDMVMVERTKMRPGMPAMENWRNPKGEIKVKVFVYGIANPYEFQSGRDKKIKLVEIGPIIYKHKVRQEDIVFEKDGSMSYTTVRDFQFHEEENEPGILNKTITVLNPMILSMTTKSNNLLVQYLDDIYLNRTVYDVLWNGSTRLLDFFRVHFSFVLPTDNFGILYNSFKPTKERYNVRIGPENNFQDFWKINTINGRTKLANYDGVHGFEECPFSVVNTTDGTGFHPYIKKTEKFRVATARVPRYFDLEFEEEVNIYNIDAYKFVMTAENFERTHDQRDCLGNYKHIELPGGVIDASQLAFDNPLALSQPHFYGFDGPWQNYLEGLSPSKEKHQSYVLLEPKTGIPLGARGSLQGNNVIGELNHFSKLRAFSNKILPTFWIEQSFEGRVHASEIYFIAYVLPVLQVIVTVLLIVASMWCIVKGMRDLLPLHERNMRFWKTVASTKTIDV